MEVRECEGSTVKTTPSITVGLILLSVALLVCVGLWAFMHQWEYGSFHGGSFTVPVRTNRFTGKVQILYPPDNGWHDTKPTTP